MAQKTAVKTKTDTSVKRGESPVVAKLNGLIADNTVYYQKTRHYHWNLVGDLFFQLHEQFEKEYRATEADIDQLAERVRALGYYPIHTMEAILQRATLREDPETPDQHQMVSRALVDLDAMCSALKEAHEVAEEAKDTGTVNMLEDMIMQLEKRAWMMRAFTKEPLR
ncbi:MAG TPA: DNA starvation/stationary phase protection protein [Chloroflexi bacterium]|jgi:starvation-inducible DNA-binding protein|nr:DNA starvation/stationary phase protection protein [Chloroflexota bacterium]HPO58062.1 DNA starvation/stationary phase protection protein [Anaerolineaceae bacterium]